MVTPRGQKPRRPRKGMNGSAKAARVLRELQAVAGRDLRAQASAESSGPGKAGTPAGYYTTGRGRRSALFRPSSIGPNAALDYAAKPLRDQARDLVRKNALASSAIERLTSNIIGTGIVPQINAKALSDTWLAWTDEADASGMLDFYGLQLQVLATVATAGECFIRFRPRRLTDGLTVPLQLEILEPEFCPHDKNETAPNGGVIRQGIEFHPSIRSMRVAYWLHRHHPDDATPGLIKNDPVRVPADQILHVFWPTRPGQIRGETWLARVMDRLLDVEDYDKAELVRKKTAALVVGFIKRALPEGATLEDIQELFGVTDAVESVDSPGVAEVTMEPGTMQLLAPGEDVEFVTPPDVGGQYEVWKRSHHRDIAAAIGILYEQLTGDYSQVNDRTWRAAVTDFRRRVEIWQHHLMVYQFCRPVWARWVALARLAGVLPMVEVAKPAINVPAKDPLVPVTWTPPAWAYINPVQDVQAITAEIRSGLKSRTQALNERGLDSKQVDREIAADNKRADTLELVFDSDGRIKAGGGAPAPEPDLEPAPGPEPDPEAPPPPEPPEAARARAELQAGLGAVQATLSSLTAAMAARRPEPPAPPPPAPPATFVLPEGMANSATLAEVEERDEQNRITSLIIRPASGRGPVLRRRALFDANRRLIGHEDEVIENG